MKACHALNEQIQDEESEPEAEEVFQLELDWTPVGKETISPVELRKDSNVVVYDVGSDFLFKQVSMIYFAALFLENQKNPECIPKTVLISWLLSIFYTYTSGGILKPQVI